MSCDSTPFLWCLPKETVSSRQRKALFYSGGSTIRVSATASVDYTFLARLGEGLVRLFSARSANESFVHLFKGGRVQGRSPCPRSAERGTLLCLFKRRRGSKGEPSPGVPPFSLRLCVCAVTLGMGRCPLLPVPPHFFALAQRNGVEPQRNALKGAATVAVRSRPPLPRTRSPNITADCVKLTLPGQLSNQPQVNLTHQSVPLGLTPKWERRVGPPR